MPRKNTTKTTTTKNPTKTTTPTKIPSITTLVLDDMIDACFAPKYEKNPLLYQLDKKKKSLFDSLSIEIIQPFRLFIYYCPQVWANPKTKAIIIERFCRDLETIYKDLRKKILTDYKNASFSSNQ